MLIEGTPDKQTLKRKYTFSCRHPPPQTKNIQFTTNTKCIKDYSKERNSDSEGEIRR